ncbi:autotransporter domain-containing protein [Martelella endophytica]|uniref:autotransporter family protein n=1 Tax=Martelella endophytica TaxID=1486262 RepID=UPI00130E70AF|nr:autotransporter domain-containing protein [Martelella endophytica]
MVSYPVNMDPSVWTVDRQKPAGFASVDYGGRSGVLAITTDGDVHGNNSHQSYEGYMQGLDVPAGDSFIGGDIFISDGWQQGSDSDYIRTGMWGSATSAENVENNVYDGNNVIFPIVNFTNQDGEGHLEVYIYNQGGWVDLPETAGLISYGGWNTVDMRMYIASDDPDEIRVEFYFNETLIYTWDTPVGVTGNVPEQYFRMYLNNFNNQVTDYTTYWSDLMSGLLLAEGQTTLGDTPGNVRVQNDGTAVTITSGSTIGGSVVVRGNPEIIQPVTFGSGVTVEGNVNARRAQLLFPTITGASPVTINGDLVLTQLSSSSGGTTQTPVVIEGSGYVDETSTLAGNFFIRRDLQSFGFFAPGNSIGMVTIGGNLDLGPTSVYNVEVDLAGNADLIDVGGVANLDGSVVVDVIDGYLLNYDYVILTADGGFNGTRFDSDTPVWNNINDYAFVSPLVTYDANNVYLTIQRNGVPLSAYAQTPNQLAVADALEDLGTMATPPALYDDIILTLTVDQAPTVYNALSPEIYASASTAMIDQAHYIQDAVTGRLQQAFGGVSTTKVTSMSYAETEDGPESIAGYDTAPESTFGAWGYAYGGWTDWDGNSNAGKLKSSSGGFLTGFDGALGDNWRAGVLAGYGYTSFSNKAAASGDSEAYTIGAYTGGLWPMSATGGLSVSSGLSYTWNTPSVDRTVSFTGFSDKLKGEYDAGTFQVFGELAYEYKPSEEIAVEPYANLSYVNFNADSFSETGTSAAALSVASQSVNTYFTTLGFRASTGFDLGQVGSSAFLDIGWRHAYGDTTPDAIASFVGSSPFLVAGVPIAEDTAVIGAGIDFGITEMASIGVSYSGQFGSGISQNSVSARLDVKF